MKTGFGVGKEHDRAGHVVRLAVAVLRGDGRYVDDTPVMLRPHALDGLSYSQESAVRLTTRIWFQRSKSVSSSESFEALLYRTVKEK